MILRSTLLSALLVTCGIGAASADVGDLRTSVSYNATASDYKDFNDAADRDRYMVTARGTYTYSEKLKLGLSIGLGESEADRAVGFFSTDSDIQSYAVNASYRVTDNWSAFAGIGYTDLQTDGDNRAGARFSTDGNGFSYIAGAAYDRDISDNLFFLMSGSVSYSEIDIDAFTGFFAVPATEQSITTIVATPELGYIHGDFTFVAGVSYVRANRDVRLVDDPTRYEAALDVTYDLGNDWYVTGGVGRNFSEKSTKTVRYTLNVSKTISLMK